MTDQVTGFDGDGLIGHNDPVMSLGLTSTLQRFEVDVLINVVQFAEFAFAADSHFRAWRQFRDHLAVDTRLGTNVKCPLSVDPELTIVDRRQMVNGEIAAQQTFIILQSIWTGGVLQPAVITVTADRHLRALWQKSDGLAPMSLIANIQTAFSGPQVVNRVFD
ncbi:hypothetical protein, partial [Pseudomonas sp. Z18(2022)]|uniref:hypothetical protein n=1 Tax=Pseudomonas sp. Z18(2022) TaxID=2983410 RepID=UPI002E7FF941